MMDSLGGWAESLRMDWALERQWKLDTSSTEGGGRLMIFWEEPLTVRRALRSAAEVTSMEDTRML